MSKDTPKLAIYDFTNSGLETVKLNQGAATARAINRALKCGVNSIEHGNLLDKESIRLLKNNKAFRELNEFAGNSFLL